MKANSYSSNETCVSIYVMFMKVFLWNVYTNRPNSNQINTTMIENIKASNFIIINVIKSIHLIFNSISINKKKSYTEISPVMFTYKVTEKPSFLMQNKHWSFHIFLAIYYLHSPKFLSKLYIQRLFYHFSQFLFLTCSLQYHRDLFDLELCSTDLWPCLRPLWL